MFILAVVDHKFGFRSNFSFFDICLSLKVNEIKERISNLNSFFYMRFDNGFLAPLLAYLVFLVVDINEDSWLFFCNSIAIFTSAFILIFIIYCLFGRKLKVFFRCFIILVFLGTLIGVCCYKGLYIPKVNYKTILSVETNSIHNFNGESYTTTKYYSIESVNDIEMQLNNIKKYLVAEQSIDNGATLSGNTPESIVVVKSNQNQLDKMLINPYGQKNESAAFIAKAEIQKIDDSLLRTVLIACLIISLLLLSYIPRIYQELREYNDLLSNTKQDETKRVCLFCMCVAAIYKIIKRYCREKNDRN